MSQQYNVLALAKGEEWFIYVYDDQSRPALEEQFAAQALDPSLGFSWFDAAVMGRKADEQAQARPRC